MQYIQHHSLCSTSTKQASQKWDHKTFAKNIISSQFQFHKQNFIQKRRIIYVGVVDNKTGVQNTNLSNEEVDKLIEDFNFPIPAQVLIEKAKQFIPSFERNYDENLLADDFLFVAPVVGPIDKNGYIKSLKRFDLKKFVDYSFNFYSYTIDPFQPNRVWMQGQATGKFVGPLTGTGVQPKKEEYLGPPEVISITFNEQGLVTKLTAGYVIDKTVGNTGGLGGIFGMLYAFGAPLPFPEAQPWKMSWQFKLFSFILELKDRFLDQND